MKLTQNNLGTILKEARRKKLLTQEELADRVGKKRTYITRIENEKGNNIKISTLIEIIEEGLGGEVLIQLNEI